MSGTMITEDDVLQITQWLQQRRERLADLMDIIDVKDPKYQELVEDAELCDLSLDVMDQFRASDLCVTALGYDEPEGEYHG